MKHIPNAITLCSLAIGFLAVVMAFENQLLFAGLLILSAAVLDFLDGFLARSLDAEGELGKQLDSLADLTCFGMAPAVLVLELLESVLSQSHGISGISDASLWARTLLLSPVLLLLCAAVRLARYNTKEGTKNFTGLATPACGIFFAGITVYVLRHPGTSLTGFMLQPMLLLACIILISLLMILPLPMFSLKFTGFGWKGNEIRYVFLTISGILLIILQEIGLPVIIIMYLTASLFQSLTSTISK